MEPILHLGKHLLAEDLMQCSFVEQAMLCSLSSRMDDNCFCRYLRETIKNSKYYVENIEDADIVYVDDYCYYIWWLGDIHYRGRKVTDTPGTTDLAVQQHHLLTF